MGNALVVKPINYTSNKILNRVRVRGSAIGPLTFISKDGLTNFKIRTISLMRPTYQSPIGNDLYYGVLFENFIFIPDDHE